MGTLKRTRNVILATAATAAVIGCGTSLAFAASSERAGPAAAAKTWTVSPGGAATSMWGKTTLTDTTTGTAITCKSTVAAGTLMSGSGLSGKNIGQASGAPTFEDCIGPLRLPWWTYWPVPVPWPWLRAVSFNSATGVATGTLTGIHATVGTESGSCSAVLDGTSATADNGTLKGTYSDATGKGKLLGTGGHLHLYDVSGCTGLINNGDAVKITGSYSVTPVQTITSP